MKLIKKLIKTVLILALIFAAFITYSGYSDYKKAISENPIEEKTAEIKNTENYSFYDELPKTYTDAVISVEDRRFNIHNGVDFLSLFRATVKDISEKAYKEGGSTITQQLAKNMYFSQDKSLKRKVAEMFVAFKLEKLYSKNEIFELYVNKIYFGNEVYGIGNASRYYFNCSVSDLNDSECVILAGIPNAPSVYSDQNSEYAYQREIQVLESMVKNKCLTKEEAEKIIDNKDEIIVNDKLKDFFNSAKKKLKKEVVNLILD